VQTAELGVCGGTEGVGLAVAAGPQVAQQVGLVGGDRRRAAVDGRGVVQHEPPDLGLHDVQAGAVVVGDLTDVDGGAVERDAQGLLRDDLGGGGELEGERGR